jgi:hypothetical protein
MISLDTVIRSTCCDVFNIVTVISFDYEVWYYYKDLTIDLMEISVFVFTEIQ